MNPYSGKHFFEFFAVLTHRLWQWLCGGLPLDQLASDEVQMLVLMGVAASASLIGVFLVLKRMTMLANSLSHTILLGIVIAYLILLPFVSYDGNYSMDVSVLFIASLVTGLVTTLLTQTLNHLMKLQEDASIGLVFTTLFALGIVLITVFTRNSHIGTEAVMGNADALHLHDLKMVGAVLLLDFLAIGLFFKQFQITAFDSGLASSLGIPNRVFNYFLMVLTAATAIGAFRAVGVLLVLAFFVGPVLTARLLTHHLKSLLLIAIGIGIFCSIAGVALSRHFLSVYHAPLSTGGLVVAVIAVVYGLVLLFSPPKGLVFQWIKRKSLIKGYKINIDI